MFKLKGKKSDTYMKKYTYWVASTYSVFSLQQIFFKSICIPGFNYVHSHPVQCLDRFMNYPVFLVIVHVTEPAGITKNRILNTELAMEL